MRQVLTVFEHESIAITDRADDASLSREEADRLFALNAERPGFCSPRHRSVRLAQYAGLVTLGGRMLEILPKVSREPGENERGRRLLLRMLRLARRVPLHRDEDARHELRRATLLEVFIEAFLAEVSDVVRAGLIRRYRVEEEDLPLVRGRLLVREQLTRNAMRFDRIACRYDDLSADNAPNRALKAALGAVRPWIASTDLGRRWFELSLAFDEVPAVRVHPKDVSAIALDRQAIRYRTSLRWAAWILAMLSPTARGGQEEAPGLLFDMNKLFEASVAAVLRRERTNVRVDTQSRRTYLATLEENDRPAVELIPDLVVSREGAMELIADTKWKLLDLDAKCFASPKPGDLYQLNAYATAHGCREYAIYYPWHSGLSRLRPTTFEIKPVAGSTARIGIVAVDLEADPARFLAGGVIDAD